MFCPNCGNNIPDDSAFCGHCGTSFAAAAPVATAAAPVPGTSAKQRGLSKKQFLATEAAPGVKAVSKIALGVFAAILALILLATITLNTISVVDLPIIKMAVDESEREELVDSMDEASDSMEKMEDALEEIEEELGSKAARQAKKVINKWEKVVRKLSLANLITVVDATHNLADDVSDKLGMDNEIEELEEIAKILKTVRTVIYIFGVVIALLALWAAAGKAVFPCVLGILLSAPVYCLLASVLLGILIVVAFIVLAVFCSKVNKAWKKVAI
jgi:hypothetical protein